MPNNLKLFHLKGFRFGKFNSYETWFYNPTEESMLVRSHTTNTRGSFRTQPNNDDADFCKNS